ncbi:GNAT family N-acetyltransferase [Massilia sp. GCM10020059]|uniref:GNAT family N-acetyltransferase n=1 Tax=Massilia agrisoli TaxID=2892444 RepID=A0ABS8IQX4_9BURK|nr:GNAT family N-acetyltransferase [Massilia agrisoli]MCC6070242.1 GNAT family N-acetyltransferase [Massilia agrisoli]
MGLIHVRDVTRSHSALIPSLFPDARDVKATPALYAAFDTPDGAQPAGFALLCSPTGAEHPCFRFAVVVAEHARRRGIGAALTQHVADTARTLRAPSLRPLVPVMSDGGHQLMARAGFKQLRRTLVFEFSLAASLKVMDAQLMQLEHAGRVPAGISSDPYRDNQAHDLSAMCQRSFGMLTHGHLEAMGEYPAPGADLSHARAFRLDGTLIGAWGVVVRAGTAVFDPLLIAEDKRSTWAFPFVTATVLRTLVAGGVTHGLAKIHEDNRKMIAVMGRFGTEVTGVDTLYELALAGDPA